MKNEARDAVANLRESIDMLVLRLGLDLEPMDEIDLKEMVLASTPEEMIRELEAIGKIVDEMDKQVLILEDIDDNDIMEHAHNDLKQITPEDC